MAEHPLHDRLRPIRWLNELPPAGGVDTVFVESQEIEAREAYVQNQLVPTIGCEIEVKRSSLYPGLLEPFFGEQDVYGRYERRYEDLSPIEKEKLDELCRVLDEEFLPRYEETVRAGIPKGLDAQWEFANAPAYAWQTLAAEVELLFNKEFIPVNHDHSLHVTLGGVELGRGGMGYVLSGLELLFAKPARIQAGMHANKYGTQSAWARRGEDGLRQRSAGMLALGHSVATELRTLTVDSPVQAKDIFETAQVLTALLMAHRRKDAVSDEATAKLAALWSTYASQLKAVWSIHGLPNESWGKPKDNSKTWQKWVGAIALRAESGSFEFESASSMQALVTAGSVVLKETRYK